MAFTILRGTILKSLIAFESELAEWAKEPKYAKEQNGVVVSTIEGHKLTYHKTEHSGKPGEACPISRSVVVEAHENGRIDVLYRLSEDEVIAGIYMTYPFITEANDTILNFLIHGAVPYTEN